MSTNEPQRFYDALVKQVDHTAQQTIIETADGRALTFPKAFQYHHEGARGVLTLKEDGDFAFWPYIEQRLRRWPEQDYPGDEAKGYPPFWSWKLEGSEERISCKPHFVPGKDGSFVEDETEPVEIPVPPEFFELCASRGRTVEDVLRGFIADVCGLQNYVVNPRADGYSSNGSDERMYADQWFERAYPKWDND